MRIKFIVPFPFEGEALARRAAQIPRDALAPSTQVECVAVRNSADSASSAYDLALLDMYVTEAGLRAEEEGFDALVMDSLSDSGLATLRSRLTIPVVAPGQTAYAIASLLGKKFSIVMYLDEHKPVYEKAFDAYGVEGHCASMRAANIVPDFEALLSASGEKSFKKLTDAARRAIEEDGAEVIILGSTTMHEAGGYMREHLPAPVINPGPVAIKIAETLVLLGLSHSKIGHPSPQTIQDEKWFSLMGAARGHQAAS